MIRAVLDTNIIVSGLLWRGFPGKALNAARAGRFRSLTSERLITELEDVLSRPKFVRDLSHIGETVESFLENDYRLLAQVIETPQVLRVVASDPDDDAVIACATAGKADYIVSGDRHLLSLGHYQAIEIIPVAQFVTDILGEIQE